MSQKHEKRIGKLEKISPSCDLPWIKLIKEENQTLEEVFEESGHPGRMEDYRIFCCEIIDATPTKDDGDFKASLHPSQAN